MKVSKKMVGGREQFTAYCTTTGCKHVETATDKSSAKRKIKSHDRNVHVPKRRAARSAKRDMKRYGGRETRIKESMSQAEMRHEVAKAKSDFQDAARKAEDAVGPTNRARGMYTKGIPGVPDGQRITGLVYDEDNKRVPWRTITKYMNVD